MRSDRSTFTELLKVVCDDHRARVDATFNEPVGADLWAELDSREVSFAIGAGEIDLVQSLELLHRNLRDEQGVVANFRGSFDAAELARAQNVARIREGGGDADSAGLRVYLAIDESDFPFCGKTSPFESVRVSRTASAFRSRSPPLLPRRWVSARYSESLMEK